MADDKFEFSLGNYLFDFDDVNLFFRDRLSRDNKAIFCEEFFCPLGLKFAMKKKRVVVVHVNSVVVSALRFYLRKSDDIVSVYQFAIDENYVGNGLLVEMLKFTGCKEFEVLCPVGLEFNNYYEKSGWDLFCEKNGFNYWGLSF